MRALAESIRLQKKNLGLPYGGQISEAQADSDLCMQWVRGDPALRQPM